jgi:hypothetical protein
MASKQKYKLALNPATRNLEWAPAEPGRLQSMAGWLILAVSTILFLSIAGYCVFVFVLSSPRFDVTALPGGGPSVMEQGVQQLHSTRGP